MEGATICFIEKESNKPTMHYYACIGDDTRQDAWITYINTEWAIQLLVLCELVGQDLLQPRKLTTYEF